MISFTDQAGRQLLREALAAGTAEAFFPLIANLHTQAEPSWCGLGTLVTVLNALEIDPGRTWKGPWRWFGEELLSCCKSLDQATAEGVTLSEVACMARCNSADALAHHAVPGSLPDLRAALEASTRAPAGPFVIANYHRGGLGQTGSGHFSPLAAWHPSKDLVLILDVARFKYPPHWVPLERLWQAMRAEDSASQHARGWIVAARSRDGAAPDLGEARALAGRLEALGITCPVPPAP